MIKRRWIDSMVYGFTEAALWYPVVLLFSVYILESPPYYFLTILWISVASGALIGMKVSGGRARLRAIPLPLLISVLCYFIGGLGLRSILIFFFLLLCSLKAVGKMRGAIGQKIETSMDYGGLVLAFFVYILTERDQSLYPYKDTVFLAGWIILSTIFLRSNLRQVKKAAGLQEDERVPSGRLIRVNRILTLILTGLILFLGGFQSVFAWILNRVLGLIDFSYNGGVDPENSLPPVQEGGRMEYDSRVNPYHPFGWIQLIWNFLLSLILLALLILVLYTFYKLLKKWLPAWLKQLLGWMKTGGFITETVADETGYVDEVESISETRKSRIKRKKEEPNDPTRRAYMRMVQSAIKGGYPYNNSLTPTETGQQLVDMKSRNGDPDEILELVDRYNSVRYRDSK